MKLSSIPSSWPAVHTPDALFASGVHAAAHATVVIGRPHFSTALAQQKPSMAANAPLRKELAVWHAAYGEASGAGAGAASGSFGFHVADPV
jgi:hypothetical protein